MKKWMWLMVPVAIVGLALVFWGGAVFAQEPTNSRVPVTLSGNWTGMADYCRGLMNGTQGVPGANWTEMQNYCQNASGMMGANITGSGMMRGGGMMNGGGMMGNGSFGYGMMVR